MSCIYISEVFTYIGSEIVLGDRSFLHLCHLDLSTGIRHPERETTDTVQTPWERSSHLDYHFYFISVNWFLAVNSSSVYTCKSPLITLFNFLPSVKSHFCLYLFIYYTPYFIKVVSPVVTPSSSSSSTSSSGRPS